MDMNIDLFDLDEPNFDDMNDIAFNFDLIGFDKAGNEEISVESSSSPFVSETRSEEVLAPPTPPSVNFMTHVKAEKTSEEEEKISSPRPGQQKRQGRKRGSRKRSDVEEDFRDGDESMPNSNIQYDPRTRKGNAFAFSKDELATITPQDLENYEQQVREHHDLSSDELALLKKYRRQVRNRKSAQNSRARKRQYTEQLEGEVEALKAKYDELQRQCGTSEREVQRLRERVHYLEGVLDENNISYRSAARATGGARGKAKVGVAGFAAFVFIFSFGVFFLPMLRSYKAQSQLEYQSAAAATGRQLLEDKPVPPAPKFEYTSAKSKQLVERKTASDLVISEPLNEPPKKNVRIVEEQQPRDKSMALVPVSSVVNSPFTRQHSEPSEYATKWNRPNTEYLYCPTAYHVLSTKKAAGFGDENETPARISLLLPSEAFNETLEFPEDTVPPPMVEVTCSILDIWPIYPLGVEGK